MNKISFHGRSFSDLAGINSHDDYHSYFIEEAMRSYERLCRHRNWSLGSVLAVGANYREAIVLKRFPFSQIVLSGIIEPDELLMQVAKGDLRISYEKQNCESLDFPSRSFDLVFCKEMLHHLPRPVLGLYEMLRVSRQAAVMIEGYDTFLLKLLERLGLSSVYETECEGENVNDRSNFVYRWTTRQLECLLNSYYLESGYELQITLGWLRSRYNGHESKLLRRSAAISGWLCGFVPGSRGNSMTALICPGVDTPPDPPYCNLTEIPSLTEKSGRVAVG